MRGHALAFLAVVLATVLAYLPCLDGEFQFDDALGFERGSWQMPEGREGQALAQTLAHWSSRGFVHATYQLNWWLAGGKGPVLSMNFGGNPLALTLSFHLFNLLAHLAAAGGLYAILAWAAPRLKAPPVLAPALGAAFFALHPLASEGVAYTSARSGTLAAAFGLWGVAGLLRLGARGPSGERKPLLSRSLGLVLLLLGTRFAVGCKETGWAVPLLGLSVLAWTQGLRPLWEDWRAALVVGVPALLVGGAWVLTEYRPLTPPPLHALSGLPSGRLLAVHAATELHAWAAFLLPRFALPLGPWHPTVDPDARMLEPGLWTALEVLGLAAAALWARKRPWAALSLAWMAIGALPSSAPILLDVTAERHAYLPLAAGALGLAPALSRRWRGGILLLLFLGALTFARVSQWRTEWALWHAAVRDAPGKPRPRYNLAKTEMRMAVEGRPGQPERSAERQLRASLVQWPGFHLSLGLLGACLERQGRLEEALTCYRMSLVAHGNAMVQGEAAALHAGQTPRMVCAIGRVLERMGRGGEAQGDYEALIALHLVHARGEARELHRGQAALVTGLLARHHMSGGRMQQARAVLEGARVRFPDAQGLKDLKKTLDREHPGP